MKVAIISPALRKRGGIERVPIMQAKLLSERGYDVTLITSSYDEKCYPELLHDSKVKVKSPNISLPLLEVTFNTIYSAFQSYKMAKNCDVIVSHMLADAYRAKNKLKKPCILYLHTLPRHPKRSVAERVDRKFRSPIMIPPHLIYKVVNPVTYRWSDLALTESDMVFVNSKNVGKQLEEYCGRRDYVVCYPAMETSLLQRRNRQVESELRERFGLGDKVILSVSRHQPKKSLHWLPQVLHHVLREVSNAQVVITGSRTPHTKLIDDAIERWKVKGKIVLVGEVGERELRGLYHIAKVLAYPCVREDFGLPVIEAMCSGCPPIAWDDDSGPSETISDGVEGFLTKPYRLEEMAEKIVLLLTDEGRRKELAENGLKKAKLFDWKHHGDVLEEGIGKVAAANG